MALTDLTPVTRMESILNGDDIEPVTREEYFVQQAASGGGGGLPAYTSSDVGKVLTVGQQTETVVVVPEQTVKTDKNGKATLTGVDFSRLMDGDTVSTTIAGFGTQDTVYESSGSDGEGLYSNGHLLASATTLFGIPSATVTISAFASLVISDAPGWQTAVLAYDYASATAVDHANELYANIAGTVVRLRDIGEQNTVVMVISDTVPTIPSMASYSVDDSPVWGLVNTVEDAMTTAFDGTGLPTSGQQCYYIANSIVLHVIKIGEDVNIIVVPTDADIRAYVP